MTQLGYRLVFLARCRSAQLGGVSSRHLSSNRSSWLNCAPNPPRLAHLADAIQSNQVSPAAHPSRQCRPVFAAGWVKWRTPLLTCAK